jgi:nucleotide-binding universal stress UspA family protein
MVMITRSHSLTARPKRSARPVNPGDSAPRRIVVGTDESYWGKVALRWAVRHARLTGGELEVRFPAEEPISDRLGELRRDSPELSVVVRPGDRPVQDLVAASREAALVVLGCQGSDHPGIGLGAAVGPVAELACCDVVVVGGHPAAVEGRHQRVTVLLGPDPAEHALRGATRFAALREAELVIRRSIPLGQPEPEKIRLERAGLERAADLVRRWAPSVKVTTELTWAAAHDTIAAATDVDLLVVGVDGPLDWLARVVLHHAPCPVLITHRPPTAIPQAAPSSD